MKNKSVLFICLLLAALALLFWVYNIPWMKSLPDDNQFFSYDMRYYFYPQLLFEAGNLKAGVIPFWNSFQSCGYPFLATLSTGTMYPLNVICLLMPVHTAMGASFVLHIMLAGIFMFLLMRNYGISIFAATMSSLAYMFSNTVLTSIVAFNSTCCLAWTPLVVFFFDRLMKERKALWGIFLGCAVAIQFLAGYMQYFVYTIYFLLFYGIYVHARLIRIGTDRKELLRTSVILALGALIFAGLVAVQLIPTAQLISECSRSTSGLEIQAVTLFNSSKPLFLLSEVSHFNPYFIPPRGSIGILPFVLALFAIFNRKNIGHVLFFLGITLLAFFLSAGEHTPLYELYYRIPTGNWFRGPFKFLYLFNFSTAVLCGFGSDHLTNIVTKTKKNKKDFFSVLVLSGMILLYVLFSKMNMFTTAVLIGIVPLLGAALIPKAVIQARYLLAGIVVVAILIVFSDNKFLIRHPAVSKTITENDPACQFIKNQNNYDRTYIVRNPQSSSKGERVATLSRIYATHDIESFSQQRLGEYSAYLTDGGEPWTFIPYTGYLYINSNAANLKLLDLMGARYILEFPGENFIVPRKAGNNQRRSYGLIYEKDGTRVYENKQALPRVFIATGYLVEKNRRKILETLAAASFDPFRSAVIEEEPAPQHRPSPQGVHAGAQARITRYGHTEVRITASSPAGGLLVLTDTYYPGWKAYVDGIETKIYRANYLFRAISIGGGDHEIVFRYSPVVYKRGLVITLLTLCAVAGISIFLFLSRRKQGAVQSAAPRN